MNVTDSNVRRPLPFLLGPDSDLDRDLNSDLNLDPNPGPNLDPNPMVVLEDAVISADVYKMVELIINVYVINGLSVVGSIGNVISIIILYIHGFKSSTNVVLVSMAIADLLLILTMPLRKISLIINYFDAALAITVDSYVVRYHFLTLNRVWSLISNTHVTIISVERVLAVYFPFQVGRWVTAFRMTVLVVLTHLVWYLSLIPLFTMFDLIWVKLPSLNETVALLSITPFYKERELLFNHYNSYFINITVGAFLLLLTLLACVTIAVKILKMGRKRKRMTGDKTSLHSKASHERKSSPPVGIEKAVITTATVSVSNGSDYSQRSSQIDMKALKMLMAVCVTFLVLIFPTFLLAFFQGVYPKLRDPYWRPLNFVATSVSMLLISINSSVNFIIYIIFSYRFNRTFVELFTCSRWKKKRNNTPKPGTTTRST